MPPAVAAFPAAAAAVALDIAPPLPQVQSPPPSRQPPHLAPPPKHPAPQELSAAFSPDIPAPELPLLWGNLSHALSGLFCASLNFLARPETTALQAIELAPDEGASGGNTAAAGAAGGGRARLQPRPARLSRLYAALPKEVVCTENLTPALKLLPCRDQAGAASLLLHRPAVYGTGGRRGDTETLG